MSESLLDFDSWPPGITQASIPANNNARRAEALAGSVISASTTAQPASPNERDIYIIPAGATGTNWAAFDPDDLVIYYDATWTAYAPFEGLRKRILDIDENWQFMGGSTGWAEEAGGGGGTYTGTAGRITVTGTVINLDPAYVGQNTITTLGTIATGTWNATAISAVYGGTGQTGYAVGDILFASTTTALSKLAAGTNGQVLTLAAGVPTWAAPASGMTNPMTTTGDMIYSSSGSTPARLGVSTNGFVLTLVAGVPAWAASGGLTNPMTTAEDLIVGGASGTPTRQGFAANTFPARASTGGLVAKTITDFALTLLDDAAASNMRTTLGLVIGTDVAPIASPTFTGVPAAPTATAGTRTTQLATTDFVNTIGLQSVSSSSTVTPTFANDMVIVTAQAAALLLANPTGTAQDGWGIVIRIKDNGTARAISYDTQYRAVGVSLPTTTVLSKTLYLGMIYNSADTKWDVVSVAQQA